MDDDGIFLDDSQELKIIPKTFTCQICNETFSRSYAFKRHLEDLHPEEIIQENHKTGSDLTISNAETIIKTEDEGANDYSSDDGPPVIKSKKKKIKFNKGFLKCTVCQKISPHISEFIAHMSTHSGEKIYECPICRCGFSRIGSVNEHMRTHREDRPFKCSICSWKFKRSGDLTVHMRKHAGERNHQCDSCGKSYLRIADVNQHKKRYHEPKGKKFKCDICPTVFSTKYKVDRHRTAHLDGEQFKCVICKKIFEDVEPLKIHSNDCYCSKNKSKLKTFNNMKVRKANSSLPISRQNKSNAKKCKECLRPFKSSSELCRHYFTNHNLPVVVLSRIKIE